MNADSRSLRDPLPSLFWLGGSPCGGKSSVADQLAARFDLTLYRCDDAYFRHVQVCNPADHPTLHAITQLSWDEIWMRGVAEQVAAEFAAYREEFALILADLQALPHARPVLVEGCALLPELVAPLAPPPRALWFVPTPAFQRHHYAQRGFIREILVQCRYPQTAWHNWMARDEQFGREVAAAATARGYTVTTIDGSRTVDELAAAAAAHFGLAPAPTRPTARP
jgi:2-phosphoglycerate kinase